MAKAFRENVHIGTVFAYGFATAILAQMARTFVLGLLHITVKLS
jgi:hypothetical protein